MVNVLLSTGIVSAGEFASFKGGVNRKIEQGLIFDFFDWDKGCKAPNKGVDLLCPSSSRYAIISARELFLNAAR